jgi:hypothetical protein
MPKRTFKDKLTLGNGGDEIDLFCFGRSHTNRELREFSSQLCA